MRHFAILVVACLWLGAGAYAQTQPEMTNADVLKMVAAGLSESIVVSVVQKAASKNFDTSPEAVLDLKAKGVPDAVIAAMLGTPESVAPPAAPAVASPVPADPNDPLAPHERGIYLDMGEGGSPRLVRLTEKTPVAQSFGGTWKAAFTSGLTKTKLNYRVRDARADCRSATPRPVFYFYALNPQEFVLLKMKVKGQEREFTSIVMGMTSSRSAKGEAELAVERVKDNIYRVAPATPLPPGEYGIGMPTGYGGGPITVFDFGVDPVQSTRAVR